MHVASGEFLLNFLVEIVWLSNYNVKVSDCFQWKRLSSVLAVGV